MTSFFLKHLCLPTPRCISQSGRKCKWWKTFAHIPSRHTSAVCRAHVFIYSLCCTSCHPASTYYRAVIMFFFFKDRTVVRFVFTCKQKQARNTAKRNYANRWARINLNIHRIALRSDCSHPSHTRPTKHRRTLQSAGLQPQTSVTSLPPSQNRVSSPACQTPVP